MPRLNYDHLNIMGQFGSGFLDSVGDGTGSIDMNVDGSTETKEFMVTAPDGYAYILHRLIWYMADTGSFDSGGFGNGSALTNGIDFILRDGVDVTLTKNLNIKKNSHIAAYSYDMTRHNWGSGDEFLVARFTFDRDGASLLLNPGDSFVSEIKDDCSILTEFHVRIGMTAVKV